MKYEVYVTGECMGTSDKFDAKSDASAKRQARGYHNPHQSNWTWYGSTILTNLNTGVKWTLEAGRESRGWQPYND